MSRPRLAADLLGPDSWLGPMIAATILPLISANSNRSARSLLWMTRRPAPICVEAAVHLRHQCRVVVNRRYLGALGVEMGHSSASTVEDDGVRSTRLVHQTALLATGITVIS